MRLIKNLMRAFSRRDSTVQTIEPVAPETSWDPAKSWYASEEEELEERLQEQIWETLENARVSTAKQRVLFPGGLRLTLNQTMGHLQKLHRDVAADTLESALLEWLEMNCAPENVTQEEMDEHDQAVELWISAYWKKKEKTLENS